MSQVNLLPPEIKQRQTIRKRTTVIAGAGVIAVLLILFFYVLQVRSLSSVNKDVDAQVKINAEYQGQIAQLQRFQDLQTQAAAQQQLLASVFANEVSFSGTLLDMSRVIPPDAFFTSLTITVTAPQAGVASTSGQIGSIAFAGEGASVDTVATLLGRLDQVKGWVNPYVTSVSQPGSTPAVQFTGTVDLTTDALTERGSGVPSG